jgi:hypothetical protein
MTHSIINRTNALKDIDKRILGGIVQDIISKSTDAGILEDLDQFALILPQERRKRKERVYILRNLTGRKAEEIFIDWFKKNPPAIFGVTQLVDIQDYVDG